MVSMIFVSPNFLKFLEKCQKGPITFRFFDYNRMENGKLRELHIKEIEYVEAKKAYVNAKFNGAMVMRKYGLEGAEIGKALKDFRRSIEADGYSFDDYLLAETQENIFEEFESLIK